MVCNSQTGCGKTHGYACKFTGLLLAYRLWGGILILLACLPLFSEAVIPQFELTGAGDYVKLKTPYARINREPGYPDIPVMRHIYSGTVSVKINVISTDSIYLELPLLPVPGKSPKSLPYDELYNPDETIYKKSELLINSSHALFDNGGNTVLEIFPFDYIPSVNLLIVKTMDIAVEKHDRPKYSGNDLLIVYHDAFQDAMDNMEYIFTMRGHDVYTHSLSETGTAPTDIVSFLRNRYSADPFRYLLLVGSSGKIGYSRGTGHASPVSDLNYSLMDTMDYFPDIIVSRLPFDTLSNLADYISNLEEHFRRGNGSVLPGAYFMATDDNTYHLLAESTQLYSMEKFRQNDYETDSFFQYYPSGIPVEDALNTSKAFAFYTGHGTEYRWMGPAFNKDNIAGLSNNPVYPVVFSFACLTGDYDYTDFLGWQWLRFSGRGALGFIGSSELTYWQEDDYLQRGFVDSLFGSGYMLEAFNGAKREFFRFYGDNEYTRGYFEQYNYFTVPDIYRGNRDIDSLDIKTRRYQTGDSIQFRADFTGTPDKPFFALLFSDSAEQDMSFSLPGDYTMNHRGAAGDTVLFSYYLPGRVMESREIIVIDEGPFVGLNYSGVSRYTADTVSMDIELKNFGTDNAHGIECFVHYLPDGFTPVGDSMTLDSLLPDSAHLFKNGLIIRLGDFNEAADTVCTLGISFLSDTVFEPIALSGLKPSFSVDFIDAAGSADTGSFIVRNTETAMLFEIENTSPVRLSDVSASISVSSGIVFNDSLHINSMEAGEQYPAQFTVKVDNPLSDSIEVDITVNLGEYNEVYYFTIPVKLKHSYAFTGPVNEYYLYTSDMKELSNRPVYNDWRAINDGWKRIPFSDDECVKVELPFEFSFNDSMYSALYVNANGIIAFDSLEEPMYSIEPLPVDITLAPLIFTGWNDFRYSEALQSSHYLDILRGHAVMQYFENRGKYVIVFNDVRNYSDSLFNFAVELDSNSISVHYNDIPRGNSLVTGVQFPGRCIAFTSDSFTFASGEDMIRDSFSLKITRDSPVYYDKFSRYEHPDIDALLVSDIVFNRTVRFSMIVYEGDRYSLNIYNTAGRLVDVLENDVVLPSVKSYSADMPSAGVYFIIARKGSEVIDRRRVIVF
ncbi:MAG: C25 family cysteine peptidase [bacterium]